MALCNSVSADRSGVAASRSFSAASTRVVLFSFASPRLQIAAVAENLVVAFLDNTHKTIYLSFMQHLMIVKQRCRVLAVVDNFEHVIHC